MDENKELKNNENPVEEAIEKAEEIASEVAETVEETVEAVEEEVSEAAEELAEEASELAEEVKEEASELAEDAKEEVSELAEEAKEEAAAVSETVEKTVKKKSSAAAIIAILAIIAIIVLAWFGIQVKNGKYPNLYNKYNSKDYVNITGRTIGEIAEEANMELPEFLEQYGLPTDMPANTYESVAYYMMPVKTIAQMYGMTFEDLKELLKLPDDVDENTEWGLAEGEVAISDYIGEENFDSFKEEYGLGDEITLETKWKDVRKTVDSKSKEKYEEQKKAEEEAKGEEEAPAVDEAPAEETPAEEAPAEAPAESEAPAEEAPKAE